MQGLVTKFFKKSHGRGPYGFIEGYDGETYFFNRKTMLTEIHEGDEVKFKASFNDKGNYARDVQVLVNDQKGEQL